MDAIGHAIIFNQSGNSLRKCCQSGSHYSCSACQCFAFYAFLESPDSKTALDRLRDRLDEIDVRSFRSETWIVTQAASFFLDRVPIQAVYELNQMPGTRIYETGLLLRIGFHSEHIRHFQPDRPLAFRIVRIARKQLGRVDPVRSIEDNGKLSGHYAQIGGIGHYAPAAVSAHHSGTAVRIEEHHLEILGLASFKEHHSISTEPQMPVAQMTYLVRIEDEKSVPVVSQQEIVASSVIFIKFLQHII